MFWTSQDYQYPTKIFNVFKPRLCVRGTFPHIGVTHTLCVPRVHRYYVLLHLCFPFHVHYFISKEINTKKKLKEPLQVIMVRTRMIRHISVHSKMMNTTRIYHNKCMRELFIEHYEPLWNGKVNKHWTLHLNTSVLTHIRLHLSWVLGYDVFHLNNEQIGKKILKTYKKSGVLLFLLNVIRNTKDVMKRYGDVELWYHIFQLMREMKLWC